MNKPLQDTIHEKICSIQLALLRYKHDGKQMTLHVKIAVDENDSISCLVPENLPSHKLLNKQVALIQKDRENYVYIGGRITREAQKNKLLLSIEIKKACWYVRKFKGSVSYLQEKYLYLPRMRVA
jgi:RNase P/RNase MRP subunit p29